MEPTPVEPIPTSETPIALPPASPRQSRLGRRAFLGLAGGAGALVALGAALGGPGWSELFGDGPARRTAAMGVGRGSKLVLVTLYGGNDGLNTVIPLADSTYTALRGSLAIEPSTALRLTDGYGLHPGMPGFKKLFDVHELAIVHGVGFADPNYSHFESMDIWQSGVPGDPVSTGWIGRWLDGTRSSPLRAISLGPTPPTALSGERVRGAAIAAGPSILPGGPLERALYGVMRSAPTGGSPLEAESAASDAVLLELDRSIGPILARTETSNPLHLAGVDDQADGDAAELAIANGGGGQASGDVLAVQLSVVANLILAGAGADVYSVELGGFDTHADQAPVQSTLLSQLDTAVTAFVDALRGTERGKGHGRPRLHRVRPARRSERERRDRPRLGQRRFRGRPLGQGRLLRRATQPEASVRRQHGVHHGLPFPLRDHARRRPRRRPALLPPRDVRAAADRLTGRPGVSGRSRSRSTKTGRRDVVADGDRSATAQRSVPAKACARTRRRWVSASPQARDSAHVRFK